MGRVAKNHLELEQIPSCKNTVTGAQLPTLKNGSFIHQARQESTEICGGGNVAFQEEVLKQHSSY